MKKALGIIFTILALGCAALLIFRYTALGMEISSGILPAAGGIILAWIAGRLFAADEPVIHRKAVVHG